MASIRLQGLALLQFGGTIDLEVQPGESVCVVGPAGAGKSRLLKVLSLDEKPIRGDLSLPQSICIPDSAPKKARPQDLGRRKGENQADRSTAVLSQLLLWDVRQTLIGDLPAGTAQACNLVEAFMADAGLVVLDGHLDRLDPWRKKGALDLIRAARDRVFAVGTNDLSIVRHFDHLIVLKEHQPLFAGSTASFLEQGGVREVTIESHFQPGVRALVSPFALNIRETEAGLRVEAERGQETAAKILREGYGDVKCLYTGRRSMEDMILDLVNRS